MFIRYTCSILDSCDQFPIKTINNVGILDLRYAYFDVINNANIIKLGYAKKDITRHIVSSHCLIIINQRIKSTSIGLQLVISKLPLSKITLDIIINAEDWHRYDDIMASIEAADVYNNYTGNIYYARWDLVEYVKRKCLYIDFDLLCKIDTIININKRGY